MLCFCEEHGDPITNLKLQKLLYYAQAWCLALYNKPLFGEKIEAWVYGPVVAEVYRAFKNFGSRPIDCEFKAPDLPDEVVGHLEEIIAAFGGYSTYQLEKMTHQEAPWCNARGNLPLDAPSNAEISHEDMKSFYRTLCDQG